MKIEEGEFSRSALERVLRDESIDDVYIEVFDSLPSTSLYLSEVLKHESVDHSASSARRLCVADWQTNGNGRRGKSWVTDRGNITFSLLTSVQKPMSELMGLSLVSGIAVTSCLRHMGVDAKLKWPNDVLVDNRKLCGLLTELVAGADPQTSMVITGIGINYRPANIEHVDGLTATSLGDIAEDCPNRIELIGQIAARIMRAYQLFAEHGWAPFATDWDELDYLRGKSVTVKSSSETIHSIARGVNEHGALLIEQRANVPGNDSRQSELKPVYSADVSVRVFDSGHP